MLPLLPRKVPGTCSRVPEVCYNFFCDFLIVDFFLNFVRLVSVESIDSTI